MSTTAFATSGARALGLTSLGIGVAELTMPRQVEDCLGLEHDTTQRGVLQSLGIRELMHGIDLLSADASSTQVASGLWARVAGDVLDTALLGIAATKTKKLNRFLAVAGVVGVIGMLDLYFARQASRGSS